MKARGIAITFGTFMAIGLLWAVAMPMNAAPDEDQHMIWAASTARFQVEPEGLRPERTMRAPTVLYVERCFQWKTWVPAACQDEIPVDPAGDFRNRPPSRGVPYYALVGLPSLLSSSRSTVHLMRIGHLVITAAMLTLGVWSMSARRPSPGSIALATVGFTPIAAFLIGTVNPSGLAIASGFAIWAGALFLVGSDRPTWQRAAAVVGPMLVFLVVRRDAVIWIAAIVAVLAGRAGPRRLVDVVRRPLVRILLLASPLALVASYLLGGDLLLRFLRNLGGSRAGTASSAFGVLSLYIEELVGRPGWIDVYLPSGVLIGWYGLIAITMLVAIGASRRDAFGVAAVAGLTMLIPYLFGVLYAYRYYQGRYGLPLALGVPMIASVSVVDGGARRLVTGRMAKAVVWTVAALSTVAFGVAMRRFTVGDRGPWLDMLFDPVWAPPLPPWLLLTAYTAVMATIAVGLSRMIGQCDEAGTSPEPGATLAADAV